MNNTKIKNKKKKGFTLVELIAVIAIIGILAAVLVPTINGYMTKAKKVKVTEQARTFVIAAESVIAEGRLKPAPTDDTTLATFAGNASFRELLNADDAGAVTTKLALVDGIKFGEAKQVTNGSDFTIDKATGAFEAIIEAE